MLMSCFQKLWIWFFFETQATYLFPRVKRHIENLWGAPLGAIHHPEWWLPASNGMDLNVFGSDDMCALQALQSLRTSKIRDPSSGDSLWTVWGVKATMAGVSAFVLLRPPRNTDMSEQSPLAKAEKN
jgi:hypothetical protein